MLPRGPLPAIDVHHIDTISSSVNHRSYDCPLRSEPPPPLPDDSIWRGIKWGECFFSTQLLGGRRLLTPPSIRFRTAHVFVVTKWIASPFVLVSNALLSEEEEKQISILFTVICKVRVFVVVVF